MEVIMPISHKVVAQLRKEAHRGYTACGCQPEDVIKAYLGRSIVLDVQQLKVCYGKAPALHDVSFHVDRGELVAIIGSNGAGKSTLMRAISGLIHPSEGQICFDGQRIDTMAPHAVARLGIAHVPEGKHTFARMTVMQNLLLGAYRDKSLDSRKEMLGRVLDMFPILKERSEQKAGTLSGGEQQMLVIARGLMSRPRLLMLDEPSQGIAPMIVERIFEAISKVRDEGLTVLLVEQNVYDALELADRAYVLQTGRTVMEGTSNELLNSDLVRRAYLGI